MAAVRPAAGAHRLPPAPRPDRYARGLVALLVLEAACNGLSLLNCALPATHSYQAKVWAPVLALAFAVVLGWGVGWRLLGLAVGLGIVVDLEVLAIILLTPGPAVDVPTAVHAWHRRRAVRR